MKYLPALTCTLAMGLALGCGGSKPVGQEAKAGAVPRLDLRAKSQNNLRQIGTAYGIALITSPPRSLDDLKANLEGAERILRSPVDDQAYEIVLGVDPSKLESGSTATVLAWEKIGDKEGGRNVLMADCKTVAHLPDADFQKTPKAKGSK